MTMMTIINMMECQVYENNKFDGKTQLLLSRDLSDDCAVNDASTLESQAVVKVKTDEGRMSKQPDSSNRYLNIDASGVLHDS